MITQHTAPSENVSVTKHPLMHTCVLSRWKRQKAKGLGLQHDTSSKFPSIKLMEYFQYNSIQYYIFSQHKFYFIALLYYIGRYSLFVLLILDNIRQYFVLFSLVFNCIIWHCYVSITVCLYIYIIFDSFCISRSHVVPSVDDLNMNKTKLN
jgi:hypothetical protein